MKKLIVSSIVAIGMAAGAYAQGTINLDNSSSAGGVALLTAGSYYSGPLTVQVWYENGTVLQGNIDGQNNQQAYGNLTGDGFTMVSSVFQTTITPVDAGSFSLGPVTLSGITEHATSGVLALVAWAGLQTTEAAAVAANDVLGVFAFTNPVGDPNATPVAGTPAALSGFNHDLVMTTTVPEPTTLALAGLGSAALLAFRRKKAQS
jgi:hypothetical protein